MEAKRPAVLDVPRTAVPEMDRRLACGPARRSRGTRAAAGPIDRGCARRARGVRPARARARSPRPPASDRTSGRPARPRPPRRSSPATGSPRRSRPAPRPPGRAACSTARICGIGSTAMIERVRAYSGCVMRPVPAARSSTRVSLVICRCSQSQSIAAAGNSGRAPSYTLAALANSFARGCSRSSSIERAAPTRRPQAPRRARARPVPRRSAQPARGRASSSRSRGRAGGRTRPRWDRRRARRRRPA